MQIHKGGGSFLLKVMLSPLFFSLIYYCFYNGEVEPLTAIISAVIWLALIVYALS